MIPINNIIELNDLIYAGANVFSEKLDIRERNPKRKKRKRGWMGNETKRINKHSTKPGKVLRKGKHTKSNEITEIKAAEKRGNTTGRNKL